VMLSALKDFGLSPDFIVYHVYPEWTEPESDALVLQSATGLARDVADLRQQLTDYLGPGGADVELLCTEINSNSEWHGRQSTSIVNGLYFADAFSQFMKSELTAFVWWDLRDGVNDLWNLDPTVYGWRTNADLGMMVGSSTYYPTYYASKLMRHFVGPNDTILNPTSDYPLLSAYGVLKADGSLALLVINKDTISDFTGQINLSGFTPDPTATIRSFGVLQDEAARTNSAVPGAKDISTYTITNATNGFTYVFPRLTLTLLTFAPSTAPLPIPTTLSLASGANPSTYGDTVTLVATVRTNGVPVGNIGGQTVRFYAGLLQMGIGTLDTNGLDFGKNQ